MLPDTEGSCEYTE